MFHKPFHQSVSNRDLLTQSSVQSRLQCSELIFKSLNGSLGAPIGNNLDADAWWRKKIEAVGNKAKRWTRLSRASALGRNLIVQAMFYGRLRYWVYSVHMSQPIRALVQKQAGMGLFFWGVAQTRRVSRHDSPQSPRDTDSPESKT